ncbi:MAG: hypothetical protein ABI557_16555, partial [Aureliella sp.]
MMRRSRRSKPVSMLGAFLIEAGTMLAIIALAQPTWTRNLIEQVTALPVATLALPSNAFAPNLAASMPQSTSQQPMLIHQALRPT